jgi:hypothetical protein
VNELELQYQQEMYEIEDMWHNGTQAQIDM